MEGYKVYDKLKIYKDIYYPRYGKNSSIELSKLESSDICEILVGK